MASGYDRRQSTRQTFAFNTPAPIQIDLRASGQSRGAQLVGGESQGGAVAAGPQTDPGNVAAGLGAFVEQVMAPHLQRRQQEEFFKGFTKAQSGVALKELDRGNSPVASIFGPSSYVEGAQYFTAKAALDQWARDRYDEIDTLKRMPSEELSKVIGRTSTDLLTGNPGADRVLQAGLIEAAGPLMNTVAKARDQWQREQGVAAWAQAGHNSAATLQSLAAAQASVSNPTDTDNAALAVGTRTFVGGMSKPEGMSDETYHDGLVSFMRGAMQDGNFFAVQALHQAGIDRALNEDDRVKLEDAEHRYSQRAIQDFTASDPGFSELAMDYENERAKASAGHPGALSPDQFRDKLTNMNAYVRAHTGVAEDVFQFSDVRGEVRSINAMVVSNFRRAQDRDNAKADRAAARAERRAERNEDNAEAAGAAGIAWASGDVTAAIAGGVERKYFDQIALRDFRSGNLETLRRVFTTSHYVSDSVRNDILATVEGSVDKEYGKAAAQAYQQWRAMYAANPGMTAAYYGDWHEKLRTFGALQRSVGPEAAYRQAFGDTARYSAASVPARLRKQADEAIASAVNGQQPGIFARAFGAQKFSAQAVAVMQNALRDRVGLALRNSDAPPSVIAPEQLAAALADGSLQQAGGEAWRAAPGTKPFRALVGLQQDEADTVFSAVVDHRLKAAGFPAGKSGNLDINYVEAPNGSVAVNIVARDSEGQRRRVVIPIAEFKQAHRDRLTRKPQISGIRQQQARGFDPNRPDKVPSNWRSYPVKYPQLLK